MRLPQMISDVRVKVTAQASRSLHLSQGHSTCNKVDRTHCELSHPSILLPSPSLCTRPLISHIHATTISHYTDCKSLPSEAQLFIFTGIWMLSTDVTGYKQLSMYRDLCRAATSTKRLQQLVACQRGVAVTRSVGSTKLLYAGPG